jgi:hypothetical protein
MKDMKFLLHYKMNFEILNNLVLELTHFSHLNSLNLVRPQLNIKKIVGIVIYRFAHGSSATYMVNPFNEGASIIKKYVDIICHVLTNKKKLLNKYINIPSSQCFKDIVVCFENLTCILNICGTIDGIHILVANLLNKKATLVVGDFFNRKSSIILCYKPCAM